MSEPRPTVEIDAPLWCDRCHREVSPLHFAESDGRSCLDRKPGPHRWRQYQWRSDMLVCSVCGAKSLKQGRPTPPGVDQ